MWAEGIALFVGDASIGSSELQLAHPLRQVVDQFRYIDWGELGWPCEDPDVRDAAATGGASDDGRAGAVIHPASEAARPSYAVQERWTGVDT